MNVDVDGRWLYIIEQNSYDDDDDDDDECTCSQSKSNIHPVKIKVQWKNHTSRIHSRYRG